MSHHDDASACASRIAVLEQKLAEAERQLALARHEALEQERQLFQLRRQLERARGKHEPEPTLPRSPGGTRDPAETRAEAERCLLEGIRLHRSGEAKQATRQFQRGLALMPSHADLLRALRLYS
jgi:hypothetical protein